MLNVKMLRRKKYCSDSGGDLLFFIRWPEAASLYILYLMKVYGKWRYLTKEHSRQRPHRQALGPVSVMHLRNSKEAGEMASVR